MLGSFISVSNISYNLPDSVPLLSNISFTVNYGDKIALIGNNGSGKTTLARIAAGILPPLSGTVTSNADIFYLPQTMPPVNGNAGSLLDVKGKVAALEAIEAGNAPEEYFLIIDNDWDMREQIVKELAFWNISHICLKHDITAISGGEKEKLLLAGAFLSGADIIIFDEPTNSLDASSRNIFMKRLQETNTGALIISHDRNVLEHIPYMMELERGKLFFYGGNYTFYRAEKEKELRILEQKQTTVKSEIKRLKSTMVKDTEKAARNVKVGKSNIAKARYPRIVAQARKGLSEISLAKKRDISVNKIEKADNKLKELTAELKKHPLKIPMPENPFVRERLVEFQFISFSYEDRVILENFNLLVYGGERLAVAGNNGVGKTTLIKLIMGILEPQKGTVMRNGHFICLDQNLSIIDPKKSVLENMRAINPALTINEAHKTLANFNFRNTQTDKLAKNLSGGELLRCCMATILATDRHPDLIIMDEPTNNLDIYSLEILESALNQYRGGLIIISHDETFLDNVGVEEEIRL
ncbi:MAG: ATP-binding cassette domain-containing protein [Deferribacteraceae bacterium]|jgi:ATPase subunit of ABC transporter with duplicated ATPase domains|nr:ATP-binding cassette domain-containing protein [Deferribacteraceae bacterium]